MKVFILLACFCKCVFVIGEAPLLGGGYPGYPNRSPIPSSYGGNGLYIPPGNTGTSSLGGGYPIQSSSINTGNSIGGGYQNTAFSGYSFGGTNAGFHTNNQGSGSFGFGYSGTNSGDVFQGGNTGVGGYVSQNGYQQPSNQGGGYAATNLGTGGYTNNIAASYPSGGFPTFNAGNVGGYQGSNSQTGGGYPGGSQGSFGGYQNLIGYPTQGSDNTQGYFQSTSYGPPGSGSIGSGLNNNQISPQLLAGIRSIADGFNTGVSPTYGTPSVITPGSNLNNVRPGFGPNGILNNQYGPPSPGYNSNAGPNPSYGAPGSNGAINAPSTTTLLGNSLGYSPSNAYGSPNQQNFNQNLGVSVPTGRPLIGNNIGSSYVGNPSNSYGVPGSNQGAPIGQNVGPTTTASGNTGFTPSQTGNNLNLSYGAPVSADSGNINVNYGAPTTQQIPALNGNVLIPNSNYGAPTNQGSINNGIGTPNPNYGTPGATRPPGNNNFGGVNIVPVNGQNINNARRPSSNYYGVPGTGQQPLGVGSNNNGRPNPTPSYGGTTQGQNNNVGRPNTNYGVPTTIGPGLNAGGNSQGYGAPNQQSNIGNPNLSNPNSAGIYRGPSFFNSNQVRPNQSYGPPGAPQGGNQQVFQNSGSGYSNQNNANTGQTGTSIQSIKQVPLIGNFDISGGNNNFRGNNPSSQYGPPNFNAGQPTARFNREATKSNGVSFQKPETKSKTVKIVNEN